jgi:hypothetical protein
MENQLTAWLVVLAVIGAALALTACGATPSPEMYARASQINAATEATATAAAIDAQARATTAAGQALATATAVAWQAKATDTAWTLSVQATQTAVPHNAGRDHAAATTEVTRSWGISVLGIFGGLAVLLLFGLAVVAWMWTRAKLAYPSRTGQMPLVLQGNTVLEPNRQLGAGVILPGKPGALWTVARTLHYLRTGEVLESPEPRLELADGNATADHYLAAAKGASQVGTAAAMFQPTQDLPRTAKLELLTKTVKGPMGISAPQTRVIATGDNAIRAIASQLGDKIPQLPAGDVIEGEP